MTGAAAAAAAAAAPVPGHQILRDTGAPNDDRPAAACSLDRAGATQE